MTSQMTLAERAEIDAVVHGKTLIDIFASNANIHGQVPAVHWKEDETWKHLTWGQYYQRVLEAAAGLASLGVGAGDFVAIQAGNRPEHVIADLGAVHSGGTGVTIYSTLTSSQIQYIAENCSAKVAVLENLEFAKRWDEIRGALPELRYLVLMDGAENYPTDTTVLSWNELLERGREMLASDPNLVDRATQAITPDSLATLIYTSGTTGVPKGVMITHRNVLWTAEATKRAVEPPPNPRVVSYLPLAHIAERVATHYLGIYLAGQVYYCGDMSQVLEYVQHARPQVFFGVPRVWEKFHTRLFARFEENPKRDLIYKALANATEKVKAEQEGRSPGLMTNLKAALFDRLVFSKVREQLGMDQVHVAVTAAAPISPELLVFFRAIGVPLIELYGMSENTGPAISNRLEANKIGTVGIPLPGVELRLADDAEILMRGGLVSPGYYKMAQETAETFDSEGWLHSGDLGHLDDDGFLTIVGRKKEIIITAAGKNVAPSRIETEMKNHPLVSQACMVGDRRNYLTMLIALDSEEAPGWAAAHGIEHTDLAALASHPDVVTEIQRALDEANKEVARVEQVKRFTIVGDDWTPDSGEITPSLKLKRRVVLEKYADEIEAMYQP